MPDQLETLKKLQTIDAQLYRLRRLQQEKPQELAQLEAHVATQEAKVKAATDQLTSLHVAQKEKEVELQSKEDRIKKLQGQLFQLKTNKEYTTMQHEIGTHKADQSLLEEEILKRFDTIEQATKEKQTQQDQSTTLREQLTRERQRIEKDLAAIEAQIGQLERDRKTIVPEATPEALATYERILQLREGLALVPLMNDSCGGCHRRMPPQVVNEVYLKARLVTCENCSRLLYFDDVHSKL